MKLTVYIHADKPYPRCLGEIHVEAGTDSEAIASVLAGEGLDPYRPLDADTSYRLKCGDACASSYGDEFEDTARCCGGAEETLLGLSREMIDAALDSFGQATAGLDREPVSIGDTHTGGLTPEQEQGIRDGIDRLALTPEQQAAEDRLAGRAPSIVLDSLDLDPDEPEHVNCRSAHVPIVTEEMIEHYKARRTPEEEKRFEHFLNGTWTESDESPFEKDAVDLTVSTEGDPFAKRLGVLGPIPPQTYHVRDDGTGEEWHGVSQEQLDALASGAIHPSQILGRPPTSTRMPTPPRIDDKTSARDRAAAGLEGFATGGPVPLTDSIPTELYHPSPMDLLLDPRTAKVRESMEHEVDALQWPHGGIGKGGPWSIDLPPDRAISGTFGIDWSDTPAEYVHYSQGRDSYGVTHSAEGDTRETAEALLREKLHRAELDGQPATE